MRVRFGQVLEAKVAEAVSETKRTMSESTSDKVGRPFVAAVGCVCVCVAVAPCAGVLRGSPRVLCCIA